MITTIETIDGTRDVYKLTRSNGTTHGGMEWGENITHEAPGEGELSTSGWIHVYDDPILAVFMDPVHGDFGAGAILWRAVSTGRTLSDSTKRGCQTVTTVERMPLPLVSTEQRVRFGILSALEVYVKPSFVGWAQDWLSGVDRSVAPARAVAREEKAAEARAAAKAAAEAAEEAKAKAARAAWAKAAKAAAKAAWAWEAKAARAEAARAAKAAWEARAAKAAWEAAEETRTARAAKAAWEAAAAARTAAWTAAAAAEEAAEEAAEIDFVALAHRAVDG